MVSDLRVGRSGSFACLNSSGEDGTETVSCRLEQIGFGWYQVLLVMGIGVYMLSESIEMGGLSPLHTGLASAFNMSTMERALLPAFVYTGSIVGTVLAGPLGDLFGRRGALLLGLLCILLSSLLLAMTPITMPIWAVLGLRLVAGVSAAIGGPAAVALAVESCDAASRVNVMFAIMFCSSLGYLAEAFGVAMFMPMFGEGPHDNWRSFSFFIAAPSLASLPLVYILHESPSFLAVKGRTTECVQSLAFMSRCNGRGGSMRAEIVPDEADKLPGAEKMLSEKVSCIIRSYFWLVLLFVCIESSRAFFMSGSAYLCKDLFMLPNSRDPSYLSSMFERNLMEAVITPGMPDLLAIPPSVSNTPPFSPSFMNIVSSVTPLIGIIIGSRFVFAGVRQVTFSFCLLAAIALLLLTSMSVRMSVDSLLLCVLTFKLTYGPIGACVTLMRVEAFPTEVRTTAFALVSISGKFLCMAGPVIIEELKKNERADSWRDGKLRLYLIMLATGAMICGALSLFVPSVGLGDGRKLQDFAVKEDGECTNILAEEGLPERRAAYGSM